LKTRESGIGCFQDVVDLFLRGVGFTLRERQGVVKVGGADEAHPFPGDGEHGAAVAGVQQCDRVRQVQALARKHQVRTAQFTQARGSVNAGANLIAPRAGGVDDHAGLYFLLLETTRGGVFDYCSADPAIRLFEKRRCSRVINGAAASADGFANQAQDHTGVIHAGVVIEKATVKLIGIQHRASVEHFAAIQPTMMPFWRQQVIENNSHGELRL